MTLVLVLGQKQQFTMCVSMFAIFLAILVFSFSYLIGEVNSSLLVAE